MSRYISKDSSNRRGRIRVQFGDPSKEDKSVSVASTLCSWWRHSVPFDERVMQVAGRW